MTPSGDPQRQALEEPPEDAGPAEVGAPVLRPPALVPGDEQAAPAHERDELQRQQLDVGHAVGLEDIEPDEQQAQTEDSEGQRLSDRPAPTAVKRHVGTDRVVGDLAVPAGRRALPPVHRVDVDVGSSRKTRGELLGPLLFAPAVVGRDRIGDQRDDLPPLSHHMPARSRCCRSDGETRTLTFTRLGFDPAAPTGSLQGSRTRGLMVAIWPEPTVTDPW